MKSIIKKLLVRPYSWCLRTYDRFTADRIECSIADIILQRGEVVKENQLLLSSRLCDVEDYCDRGLAGFIHQNTISRKTYGAAHKEEGGNRSFAALIESYKKNGYNPSSIVTVDSDMTLMDGNHRMVLHLYEKIEKVNVRRVHRRPPYQYGVDSFYALGLETVFLEKLHVKYQEIKEWLIESGITFCAIVKGSISETFNVKGDVSRLCKVLKTKSINGGGICYSLVCPSLNIWLSMGNFTANAQVR